MVKQKLTIKIPDKGKVILSSTYDIENQVLSNDEKIESELFVKDYDSTDKVYDIILDNIRVSDDLNKFESIQCKIKDKLINKIYLLEESEYKLEYKANPIKIENKDNIFISLRRNDSNDINFKTWISGGFLNFKSYAGKTFIDIKFDDGFLFKLPIEVRSKKIDYESQYQTMIEYLADYTSNLMLNYKGPIYQSQSLENHRQTDYDYFLILTNIFKKQKLPTVYEYLSRNLISTLITENESKPINFASNIGINEIINIAFNPDNLIESENIHLIPYKNKWYVPEEIIEETHIDTLDNLENRFYKYFLELLEDVIVSLLSRIDDGYEKDKLKEYKEEVSYYLSSNYFKQISNLDYLPLNSQVLQKKEGYRDILKYYFMLELGVKISWKELDNTVKGFQKRLSQLYEMWGFFELLTILEEITSSKITDELISLDKDSLSVNLNEGDIIDSFNKITCNEKDVQIKYMYNKTFSERGNDEEYGSYSVELRPDFTIELLYENQRKFIHFDTKYKVYNKNGKESYNPEDIKKMNTYKDAIKNTIGAYVLYPGNDKEGIYEEIKDTGIGVGAFPLNPKYEDKIGEYEDNRDEIKNIIIKIIRDL